MRVAVGCDHAGFVLKAAVLDFLKSNDGFEVEDFGTFSEDRVDYPDPALAVANAVSNGSADRGIVLCGTGLGVAIAANKVRGVRAAPCNDAEIAKMSRAHNDLNVITLGGRVIKPEDVAGILSVWFSTPFEGGRHTQRLNKIAAAEGTQYAPDGVVLMDHPLIQHKLGIIRSKDTSVAEFRELVKETAMLMACEATRSLRTEERETETPLAVTKVRAVSGKKLAVIPILRAGLGLSDGFLSVVPNARVGYIGLYRDESTLKPVEYYSKFPADLAERDIFVLDPMLATGGSAAAAISLIKKSGGKHISLVSLISAPEGVEVVRREHPDVTIYTASLDSHLNENGYIVPGLGDAGDRLFGTK